MVYCFSPIIPFFTKSSCHVLSTSSLSFARRCMFHWNCALRMNLMLLSYLKCNVKGVTKIDVGIPIYSEENTRILY